ncbi:MAG: hypothetical protein DMG72_01730 [Acidobacteria bacterium]|nr:MAG: hypothetical protein DMG72_01730 [Acidobacteriota bacterium]
MEPNRENDLDGSNQAIRPEKPRQKKPYSPPKFDILTPGQAKAVLTAKALPGEAATEQLLTSISQLEKSGRTHEERPSLLVELKLDVPGKWRAVELRLAAEYLNVQHLAILRRYLDVCESVMQEAGASHE